jgi:chromosome segregation ATPase
VLPSQAPNQAPPGQGAQQFIERQIGSLVVQNASLAAQLETAQAQIAELQRRLTEKLKPEASAAETPLEKSRELARKLEEKAKGVPEPPPQ